MLAGISSWVHQPGDCGRGAGAKEQGLEKRSGEGTAGVAMS